MASKILDGFRGSAEGEFPGLAPEGVFQSGPALGNKERAAGKSRAAMEIEQTIFGVVLQLEGAATADVHGQDAALSQRRTNHEKAVALKRVFFGAHESDIGGA